MKRQRGKLHPGVWLMGGVVGLIIGLVVHGHYEPIKKACSSGAGQLSQAFDGAVSHSCGIDGTWADTGLFLIVVGALGIGVGVLGLLALSQKRPGGGSGFRPPALPKE
jgi:hypothetical protein